MERVRQKYSIGKSRRSCPHLDASSGAVCVRRLWGLRILDLGCAGGYNASTTRNSPAVDDYLVPLKAVEVHVLISYRSMAIAA
jgi:hypothetical protein